MQFHVLTPPSDVIAKSGLTIAPYDGAAEFWVDKIEDILTLFGDEELHEVIDVSIDCRE